MSTRSIKCVEKYATSKRKNVIQKALGYCREFRNSLSALLVTVLSKLIVSYTAVMTQVSCEATILHYRKLATKHLFIELNFQIKALL